MDKIVTLNIQDALLLKKFMNDIKNKVSRKEALEKFKNNASIRYTRGQWQWGDKSYNIRRSDAGCKHACVYCYVTPMLRRFGQKLDTISDMEDMPLDFAKVSNGIVKKT